MRVTRSRKGAPGLVEVAARAGVSPATVSRYFNDPDIVKPDTKARIAEAAASLGYIRDRMAGALHNRFSGTIGLIVPTIDNAIFSEFIEVFGGRLREHDRTMLIASIPLDMLEQRNVPLISAWNYRKDSRLPCVGTDNQEAGAIVTNHLLDLGHRDIAFVFPDTESNDRARDRLNGALEATRKRAVDPRPDRLRIAPYDIGEAKAVGQTILSENPPTAVVCGNDIIAQGIVYACQASGVRIPEDISIVGVGDFRGSAHMEPGLTTLRLPARKIGEQVADTILEMSLSGLPPATMRTDFKASLIKRGSTQNV